MTFGCGTETDNTYVEGQCAWKANRFTSHIMIQDDTVCARHATPNYHIHKVGGKYCAGPKTNDSTTHTKTGVDTARAPKATTTYAYIQLALATTPYPKYTVTQAESALAPVNT